MSTLILDISLLESFKSTKKGVFFLGKIKITNFASVDRYIRKLLICNSS